MLCDLCIIQLNVAYQFKTLAVEIDGKHQQYLIENGVNLSPNSENSTVHSVEQRAIERLSTTVRPLTYPGNLSNLQHRRLIKTEPTDYDVMSDITIDTNTDLLEDFTRNNGVNSSASNQPFGATSNMVCVSDLDLLRSNDSDSEFINNCLPSSFRHFESPANTVESHQSTTTTTTTTTTIASKQLVIAASKSVNQDTIVTSEKHNSHESVNVAKQIVTSEQVISVPRKGRKPGQKPKVKFADNELKKSLRPKSNNSIDYSLVRRNRKLLNPVNKVRQKIKEENESTTKQSSSKNSHNVAVDSDRSLVPRNPLILRNKRKNDFIEERIRTRFRRGQHTTNTKGQYHRENVSISRRVIIKETDRFKFAAIDNVMSTTKSL